MNSVERRDPVRLRFIEAMARRAAGYEGEVRRQLDERVAALRASDDQTLGAAPAVRAIVVPAEAQCGPLSELVARIAEQAVLRGGGELSGLGATAGNRSATTEIASLAFFRSTWSRLSAERRLTKSLATVPENAGPLNSHQLVHRALQLMRETSPGYLHHFMTYVDALLWLDQAGAGGAVSSLASSRAKPVKGVKAAVRGKSS